jgi:hypothetical protein
MRHQQPAGQTLFMGMVDIADRRLRNLDVERLPKGCRGDAQGRAAHLDQCPSGGETSTPRMNGIPTTPSEPMMPTSRASHSQDRCRQ